MLVLASVLNIVAVCELFACVANGRAGQNGGPQNSLPWHKKLWQRLWSLNPFALVPSVIFAGVMPIIARYSLGINFFRNIFVLFFTYMFTILSVAVFMIKSYPVADAAFEIVMTLYISYGFSSLVLLRDMPYGEYVYLIAFIIPWMSDAGAYFIGCNSVLSQCGDLVASLIKRHYNVKDYGYIFPGHGGVLDRFDSVIAAAPFLYILCLMLDRLSLFA